MHRHLVMLLLLLPLLITDAPMHAEERCARGVDLETLKRRSAEQDPEAMLTLAKLYRGGRCLPRDYAAARRLYEPLAQTGHPQAEFQLGLLYLNGYGVEQNYFIAEEMLRRASSHGHPSAGEFLDYLYEVGFGDC